MLIAVIAGLAATLALVTLAVAVRRLRADRRREAEQFAAEAARLQAQIDQVRRELAAPAPDAEYLITDLGRTPLQSQEPVADRGDAPVGGRIDGRLFADLVLRESVVKAAALAHGVRRALAPEHRLRIRSEMKRELRRARKQRKSDLRAARRHLAQVERDQLAAGEDAA